MRFNELAYVVIGTVDIAAWTRFATNMLGGMVETVSDASALRIRTDDWSVRMLVESARVEGFKGCGWLVATERDYLAARAEIEKLGAQVAAAAEQERSLRQVQDFFWFVDPAGNRHEVCWGRTRAASAFQSPQGVSHFVTGELGMGHVVLLAGAHFDAVHDFWTRLGVFELSDIQYIEATATTSARRTNFYHCSTRHHCIAYADAPLPSFGCHHVMLEVETLDDVGRALDRALAGNWPIACTLGRHSNDRMISFYVQTPSRFLIEFGCDGARMDWLGHEVCNYTPANTWGHAWQDWWRAAWQADQERR